MMEIVLEKCVYKCWARNPKQDKMELHKWCTENFGRKSENGWTISSHYNEQPMNLSPYQFSTVDIEQLVLFKLVWG